jgi:general secretion pathway protein A
MGIGLDRPERADYYGSIDPPFSLSPDPRFFHDGDSHRSTVDALRQTLVENHAFAIVTGDHGSGKTMVCRTFVDRLDSRTFCSYLAAPVTSFATLLQTMLVDFGMVSGEAAAAGRLSERAPHALLGVLHDFLLSIVTVGGRAVLIVDEAHHASGELLEEMRLLSNLEWGDTKLLPIVLAGRPELLERLGDEETLSLEQRVFHRLELTALTRNEVERYIAHRLAISQPRVPVSFHRRAVDAVYALTGGIPRPINQLCAESLTIGAAQQSDVISAAIVEQAAAAVFLHRTASESSRSPWRRLIPASES